MCNQSSDLLDLNILRCLPSVCRNHNHNNHNHNNHNHNNHNHNNHNHNNHTSQQPQSQQPQSQQNQQFFRDAPRDAIYIGKKPLMAYVTSTLIQLANQPCVTIKARGLSIGRAVDVSQIILKRMENAGYKVGEVRIGSETVQSEDGRTRNVSTIEIEIKRSS